MVLYFEVHDLDPEDIEYDAESDDGEMLANELHKLLQENGYDASGVACVVNPDEHDRLTADTNSDD